MARALCLSNCRIAPSRPAAAYVQVSRPSICRHSLSAGRAPDASMEAVVVVDTNPPVEVNAAKRSFPAWVVLPAGVIAVVLAGVAHRRMSSHGSVGGLEERGYLNQNRSRKDPFMEGVMRNVNMVRIEELSDDAIAAARARRSRERANHRLELDDIELPENHPWAVKKPVTAEQEELIRARLQVRRGLPISNVDELGVAATQEPRTAVGGDDGAPRRQRIQDEAGAGRW